MSTVIITPVWMDGSQTWDVHCSAHGYIAPQDGGYLGVHRACVLANLHQDQHDADAYLARQAAKPRPCFCESVHHFTLDELPGELRNSEGVGTGHDYMAVPSTPDREAVWIGPVCEQCATSHMAPYMVGPCQELIVLDWTEQRVRCLERSEPGRLFCHKHVKEDQ